MYGVVIAIVLVIVVIYFLYYRKEKFSFAGVDVTDVPHDITYKSRGGEVPPPWFGTLEFLEPPKEKNAKYELVDSADGLTLDDYYQTMQI